MFVFLIFAQIFFLEKKSILFIADKPDWAYEFMVQTWIPYLPEYDCYIAYAQDYQVKQGDFALQNVIASKAGNLLKNPDPKFTIGKNRKYSFPQYKNPPVYTLPEKTPAQKLDFDFIVEMAFFFQMNTVMPFTSKKRVVGIFTDGYPHEGPPKDTIGDVLYREMPREEFFENYLKPYDGIIAGCRNLVNAYRPFTEKIQFVYGIYKQDEFSESKTPHETFTIGWTGNPDREMKGFKEIIIPAVEELQGRGYIIRLKTKHSGGYDELFSFYTDVDLVLIASRADSGPSLFAEASLSGVPCVSTAVGLPEMVIQDGVNGFIVERDREEFVRAIADLYDNRSKLAAFSSRIKADYMKVLDNRLTAGYFKKFIESL